MSSEHFCSVNNSLYSRSCQQLAVPLSEDASSNEWSWLEDEEPKFDASPISCVSFYDFIFSSDHLPMRWSLGSSDERTICLNWGPMATP